MDDSAVFGSFKKVDFDTFVLVDVMAAHLAAEYK